MTTRSSISTAVATAALATTMFAPLAEVQTQARPVANTAVVSLRGVVFDSLHGKPVARALVEISGLPHTAVSDESGRFRIDDVPAGKHRLTFSAPSLDSMGLYAFASDVETRGDREQSVRLTTPSFRTMYERLCAPVDQAPRDSAIIFGAVRDAGTGAAVGAARVAFTWPALTASGSAVQLDVMRETRTAADGSYGVCGLPSAQPLRAEATTATTASGTRQLQVGPTRITRLDLTMSAASAIMRAADEPSSDTAGLSRQIGVDAQGFLERRRSGNGIFLLQDAFRTHNEMGQVLLRVRGLDVERINARYHYTAAGSYCQPVLIVDGQPRVGIDEELQNMSPRDVIAVEYHNLYSKILPREMIQGATGCRSALLIWTKSARW